MGKQYSESTPNLLLYVKKINNAGQELIVVCDHENNEFVISPTFSQRIAKTLPEEESNKDIHTQHCCKIHGCKYNDDECSVWNKIKNQSFRCEDCTYDYL